MEALRQNRPLDYDWHHQGDHMGLSELVPLAGPCQELCKMCHNLDAWRRSTMRQAQQQLKGWQQRQQTESTIQPGVSTHPLGTRPTLGEEPEQPRNRHDDSKEQHEGSEKEWPAELMFQAISLKAEDSLTMVLDIQTWEILVCFPNLASLLGQLSIEGRSVLTITARPEQLMEQLRRAVSEDHHAFFFNLLQVGGDREMLGVESNVFCRTTLLKSSQCTEAAPIGLMCLTFDTMAAETAAEVIGRPILAADSSASAVVDSSVEMYAKGESTSSIPL